MKSNLLFLILLFYTGSIFSQVSNVGSPYMDVQGPLYLREHAYTLNKAQNGWTKWGNRTVGTHGVVFDLSNIGSLNTFNPENERQINIVTGNGSIESVKTALILNRFSNENVSVGQNSTSRFIMHNGGDSYQAFNVYAAGNTHLGHAGLYNYLSYRTAGAHIWRTYDGSNYNEVGRIDGSGNWIIGNKNTANAKLEIYGLGGTNVDLLVNGRIKSNNDNGGLWVNNDRFIGGAGAGNIGLYTNSNWRWVVNSLGNIGFNTMDIESWNSGYNAIEADQSALMFSNSARTQGYIGMFSNAYYSPTGWKHKETGPAALYENYDGIHSFYVAQSGSINNGCNWQSAMYINNSASIGIGTTSPAEKLEIVGRTKSTNGFYATSHANPATSMGKAIDISFGSDGTKGLLRSRDWATATWMPLYIQASEYRFIEGNVIIGPQAPTTNDYRLSVDGAIRTKEVIVTTENWADFVFSSNYNLRTLTEVEKFINENSHLPDVPSEAQVTIEGISLGEMNAILLQKIEELTLYAIEQQKLIEDQSYKIEKVLTENEELKVQTDVNKALENRIDKLEALINQINK